MGKTPRQLLILWIVLLVPAVARSQVAQTVHNLSATGPGRHKAAVGEVCIFCHTPSHNAPRGRALWNRDLPPTTYTLYESSTMEATLAQPTGASRLCLSCHDGTTALGNLRVPPAGGVAAMGRLTGRSSLGTDLSDDHPVSFVYDTTLALRDGELADPTALPEPIALDRTQQLQCTTCHDPHEDRYRKFLKVNDRAGALCTSCHTMRNWSGSAHATSTANANAARNRASDPLPYSTVADNACESCHLPHAAPRPEHLLNDAEERAVCLACHSGTVAKKNLEPEFLKGSAHRALAADWVHEPREDPLTMVEHVACVDCHNPHQTVAAPASPPFAPGALRGVRGLNISGGVVEEATYEYEVCLKCHGIRDETTPDLVRQDNIRNVRLELSPSNPSFHPVAAAGKNSTVRGFEAGYSSASFVSCTDCHNNDGWTQGSTRPRGPHGSMYRPILERRYEVNDPSPESYDTYALCYKCHNRNFLLQDQARTFPHGSHVRDGQASCAACHDAHGSRRNAALINFMIRDRTGNPVVGPSATQGRIEYVSLGPGSGTCYLSCHGVNHEPESYP
jgi:predicted CXXCH cytochrome family protein